MFTRRTGLVAILAGLAQFPERALARKQEAAISNRSQIVSTRGVFATQSGAINQEGVTPFDGGNQSFAISNDSQIVSTGPVYLSQEAAGQQVAVAYDADPTPQSCEAGRLTLVGDGALSGQLLVQRYDCSWAVVDLCHLIQTCYGK